MTLQGSGFVGRVMVTMGPNGAGSECTGAEVISDKIVTCTLPAAAAPAGQPQHFIVSLEAGTGWKSGDVSGATYVRADPPAIYSAVVAPDLGGYRQAHIIGWGFSFPSGPTPLVTFEGANGKDRPCDNVLPIGGNELVCYVPTGPYQLALDASKGGFEVRFPEMYDAGLH